MTYEKKIKIPYVKYYKPYTDMLTDALLYIM